MSRAFTERYRWSVDEFVRAFDAGVFDKRVELLDGEVVPVSIGLWHGDVTDNVSHMLPREGVKVSPATLPSGASLPDPDLWVRRQGAVPITRLGRRIAAFDPTDVLLVVEVSDETVTTDLGFKAELYGSSGYSEYWVVTREAVFVHRNPSAEGYTNLVEYRPGQQLPVPYASDTCLDVAELIAED